MYSTVKVKFLRMLNWGLFKRLYVYIYVQKVEEVNIYHDHPDKAAGAIKIRFEVLFPTYIKKEDMKISKLRSGSFGKLRKKCSKAAKRIMYSQTGQSYVVIDNHSHEDYNVFDVIVQVSKKSKPLYDHQYIK